MPEAKDLPRLARAVGASVPFLLDGTEPDMANEVEKFLRGIPKRTWRKLGQMKPEELTQAALDLAALVDARKPAPPTRRKR